MTKRPGGFQDSPGLPEWVPRDTGKHAPFPKYLWYSCLESFWILLAGFASRFIRKQSAWWSGVPIHWKNVFRDLKPLSLRPSLLGCVVEIINCIYVFMQIDISLCVSSSIFVAVLAHVGRSSCKSCLQGDLVDGGRSEFRTGANMGGPQRQLGEGLILRKRCSAALHGNIIYVWGRCFMVLHRRHFWMGMTLLMIIRQAIIRGPTYLYIYA